MILLRSPPTLAVLFSVAFAACHCGGSFSSGTNTGSDAGVQPADSGSADASTSLGDPDAGIQSCGGQLFEATAVQPNVLIDIDWSASMEEEVAGGRNKWDIATDAVRVLTTKFDSRIRFGCMWFPGEGDNCSRGWLAVHVGDNTAAQIHKSLMPFAWGENTPLAGSLAMASEQPELADTTRANYVLLITDGQDTCDGQPVPVVQSLFDKNIKTFVVGFGSGVDPTSLSQMAISGGTAVPGNPNCYRADDQSSLEAALDLIGQSALGCDFKLTSTPPDGEKIYVYIDGMLVPRDPAKVNGWQYAPSNDRVTFYGPVCHAVAKNPAAKVTVVYGCPDDVFIENSGTFDGGMLN